MQNPFAHLRRDWCRTRKNGAVTGMIVLGVIWLIVLLMVGSPRLFLWMIASRVAVCPSWLLMLLLSVLFLISGFSIGLVLGNRGRGMDAFKYRGAFFFVIGVTLCYLWYALFFEARLLLIASLLALIGIVCFAVSAVNFRCVFRLASVGMWISFVIGCYLSFFSFLCFFSL